MKMMLLKAKRRRQMLRSISVHEKKRLQILMSILSMIQIFYKGKKFIILAEGLKDTTVGGSWFGTLILMNGWS
jgi:hypothetical protein